MKSLTEHLDRQALVEWLDNRGYEYNEESLQELIEAGWGSKLRKGLSGLGLTAAMASGIGMQAPEQKPFDVHSTMTRSSGGGISDEDMATSGIEVQAAEELKSSVEHTITNLSEEVKIEDQYVEVIHNKAQGSGNVQVVGTFSGIIMAGSPEEAIQKAQMIIQQKFEQQGFDIADLDVDLNQGSATGPDGNWTQGFNAPGITQGWRYEAQKLAGVLLVEEEGQGQEFRFKARVVVNKQ